MQDNTGDLLDVKATVASDNQKVITAGNSLLISKLSLAQLLQLDSFRILTLWMTLRQINKIYIYKTPTTILR
jgi:outer membrane protein